MYWLILIKQADRRHNLSLESPAHPTKEYEITTLIYSLLSSHFIALRTLKQQTLDEGYLFPLATLILHNNYYNFDMVNILAGANSCEKLLEIQLNVYFKIYSNWV